MFLKDENIQSLHYIANNKSLQVLINKCPNSVAISSLDPRSVGMLSAEGNAVIGSAGHLQVRVFVELLSTQKVPVRAGGADPLDLFNTEVL